ncbi:MAG: GNAT family N-acetyltransferase [Blastocatellia bacterium]|nr:GNAT family N-acetyltransferase [Blastocatellia bacterium]
MTKAPMFSTRLLTPGDQALVWEALHVALWDPPPAGLRPREILDDPGVRIYAENWGREGDVGVAGLLDTEPEPIGACWMRLTDDGKGLGYVDERTPQLGISLFAPFQRKGYGQPLMLAALEAARAYGHPQVSLTVHPDNPAIALYEKCGFRKIEIRRTYHLMVVEL